jgi:hypothetical protein
MPVTVVGSDPRIRVVQREEPTTDVGNTTYTESELKSILQVDDAFITAWKELFGGITSLQGYARGISEHPEDTERTKTKQKELKDALTQQYILHKETYDAAHPGGLTGFMVSIGGAMYNIGKGAAKIALGVPEFLAMLARISTWVRVGEGLLGIVCVVGGVVLLAKDLGLDNALPIGRVTSLIGKGKK